MKNIYECPKHKARAWSSKYDSFFCPICFEWTEEYCKCTAQDKKLGECDYPIIRPKTAKGLTDDL